MDRLLGKAAVLLVLLAAGAMVILLVSLLRRERIPLTLYAVVNAGLCVGLAFNLYTWATDTSYGGTIAPYTAAVICCVLAFRMWRRRAALRSTIETSQPRT